MTLHFECLAQGANPEWIQTLVSGSMLILLCAGIAKCVQIARRETTSTLCVASLGMIVAAFSISLLSVMLKLDSLESRLPRLACAGISVLLYLAAVITGIIGLVDYHHQQSRYRQGRAQAWWGITLGACFLGFFAFAFVWAAVSDDNMRIEASSFDEEPRMESETDDLERVVSENSEMNYRISAPAGNWVEMDPKVFNPLATTYLRMADPEVVVMVIAESVGVEIAFDSNALTQIAKQNLKSRMNDARIAAGAPYRVNSIEGYRFEAETTTQGQGLFLNIWVAVKNGFSYQVITFGMAGEREQIRQFADQACRSFALIDPERVSHSEGYEPAGRYVSRGYGYEIDLSGTDWSRWYDVGETHPGADFGAFLGEHSALVVIPLPLKEVAPDEADLFAALLEQLGFDYRGDAIDRLPPITVQGAVATHLAAKRTTEGNNLEYRMRILRTSECAYLVAAWKTSSTVAPTILDEAIARLRLSGEPLRDELLSLQRKKQQAAMVNALGLAAFNRGNPNEAEPYFRVAMGLDVDEVVYVKNLAAALKDCGKSEELRLMLQDRLLLFSKDVELHVLYARALAELGHSEPARRAYRSAFALGLNEVAALYDYLVLASTDESYDEALEVLEAFPSRGRNIDPIRWKAEFLNNLERHDEALAVLNELDKQHPGDDSVLVQLAETYEMMGDYDHTLEACTQLIERPSLAEVGHLILGRSQFAANKHLEAMKSFQRVLEINKRNQGAREYVDYLTRILGRGDPTLISQPIEPLAVPAELAATLDAFDQNLPPNEKYDAMELVRITGYRFIPGKERKKTSYRKYKVLTRTAVDIYSTFAEEFDPLFERIYINELTVRDATGEIIATGNSDDYYVVDNATAEMAASGQTLQIPVPGVKVGCTIDYVVTIESLDPDEEFGFEENSFSTGIPVVAAAVFFEGDLSKIVHQTSAGPPTLVGSNLMYWTAARPQVYEYETMQSPYQKFLPMVWISDQGAQWEALGETYLGEIRAKLEPEPSVIRLAEQIAGDAASDQEKLAKLANYVIEEHTYKAIEFGTRARIPHVASRTLANGYGDCKDHAVLLHQLLAAVGIESRLVLVNSSGPLVEELPSLDQFDHMIVGLPHTGKSAGGSPSSLHYIDCTQKSIDPLVAVPNGLAKKKVLLLEKGNCRLSEIGDYPAGLVEISSTRQADVELDPATGKSALSISEQIAFGPYYSSAVRDYLGYYGARDLDKAVKSLFDLQQGVSLEELSVENLERLQEEVQISFRYQVPDAFRRISAREGEHWTGRMPKLCEASLLEVAADDKRTTPLKIGQTFLAKSSLALQLPTGYEAVGLDRVSTAENSDMVRWATRASAAENRASVQYALQRISGEYPPNRYAEFFRAVDDSLRQVHLPLEIRRLEANVP